MDVQTIIKRHGFTQKELAARMTSRENTPVFPSVLCATLKNGDYKVSFLRQIANAMGISIVEFFEDEMPKKEGTGGTMNTNKVDENGEPILLVHPNQCDTIRINDKNFWLVPME